MFGKYGTITLLQLNQRNDGFTYTHITYESVQQAKDAITFMHKMRLQDKVLNVSFATENCVPKRKRIQDTNEQSSEILQTE